MRDHDDWELPDDAEGGDDAHEDDLDDEFPLGDSVADVVGDVHCQVCCRPWLVSVSYDDEGTAHVHVDASDDHEDYDG